MIKRFVMHAKKTAYAPLEARRSGTKLRPAFSPRFVVEHDFIMATYLADRVVVYAGAPAVEATASAPRPLLAGMNAFLRQLEVTFRRDPTNHRPRINKPGSSKDREQKASGDYFFLDDD